MTGVTNLFDVIRAQAFLYACQPSSLGMCLAQQVGHERMHASGCKQHCWVVFGHEWSRGNNSMSPLRQDPQHETEGGRIIPAVPPLLESFRLPLCAWLRNICDTGGPGNGGLPKTSGVAYTSPAMPGSHHPRLAANVRCALSPSRVLLSLLYEYSTFVNDWI